MKKFIYLCGMMLLSLNMMAQIGLNDMNWNAVLIEDFDEGASYWQWGLSTFTNPSCTWRAYPGSGVTHGLEHQVYQPSQCQIDVANQYMKLVAEYDLQGRIPENDYDLPQWMLGPTGPGFPSSDGLYYFSGEIDYINRQPRTPEKGIFLYGYFEIRCKLPTHRGAFPAFWLYAADPESTTDKFYEEIDIFEYSWSLGYPYATWLHPVNPNPTYAGDPHVITCGIYHNLTGESPNDDHPDSYGRVYPNNMPDVGADFHVYGCEWMPDHVYWYFDGQLINSYTDLAHIPQHPLILKTNYAIDVFAGRKINNVWYPEWFGTDVMTIDYINVYQLKWDCDTDETITCQSDLDDFVYKVKKSISITSTGNEPIVSNTDKVTFRVTDFFEVTGPFEVQQGGEFTVLQHDCPNDNNE